VDGTDSGSPGTVGLHGVPVTGRAAAPPSDAPEVRVDPRAAGAFDGEHATLAGVLTAIFVPMRVRIRPEVLARVVRRGADAIEARAGSAAAPGMDAERFEAINLLRFALRTATPPIQRFEHAVQPWVTFAILPIFALFNAGVTIDPQTMSALASPVGLGVVVGLAIGKPVGVFGASWLAVRTGVAVLPDGVSWRHMAGVACLTGIGFTMALFVTGLSFPGPGLQSVAKLGILVGSCVAAAAGMAVLLTARRSGASGPRGPGATNARADRRPVPKPPPGWARHERHGGAAVERVPWCKPIGPR
jgi:Na+:H+ antiporter, NhaA family